MNAFLGRISRPFNELSELFDSWKSQCEYMWVYEHQSDEKVSRTHCHIVILNSERDAEGLKKLIFWKKMNIEKGNAGSSFKAYKKLHDLEHYMKWFECLKYASKGTLEPLLAHGTNAQMIADESRSQWQTVIVTDNETANANADTTVVRKSKRITQFDIARMAQSAYMDKYTEEIMGKTRLEFRATKLMDIVASLLRANRMCANYRVVAGIVQDIKYDLDPDAWRSKILSMI